MNQHLTWYLARTLGMAARVVLAGSMVLGLATTVPRIRRRVDAVTTQAMHRYLGGFTIVLVAGHIAALLFDRYVPFGWRR